MKKIPAIAGSVLLCATGVMILRLSGPTAIRAQGGDPRPVEIRSWITESATGPTVLWSLTNNSGKPVVAYSVLVDTSTGSASQGCRTVENTVWGLDSRREGVSPGEVWNENRGVPVSAGVPLTVSLDYVLFKDGSSWGPDMMKQSIKIQGIRLGWSQSRRTLKSMLDREGPDAVLDVIRRVD